jgi:hypothetical protein
VAVASQFGRRIHAGGRDGDHKGRQTLGAAAPYSARPVNAARKLKVPRLYPLFLAPAAPQRNQARIARRRRLGVLLPLVQPPQLFLVAKVILYDLENQN